MTLLAHRPVEAPEARPASNETPHQSGTYVTTQFRATTTGSYVTTQSSGPVPAGAIRGQYVSLSHRAPRQHEGRYTDRS
ncbi:hypothetical protein [uncultured Arthrobacter sp.]|uniref:hypothetical protein n=1 Tax=uncultured Arthrobacter sp. TaxID=114050 RepID=UPI002604C254|nr:hypothetical protein [uncultured Arthrobacter sp.]